MLGLLIGALGLGLFNAGVVFGQSSKPLAIRLSNLGVGQVTPFGTGAPASSEAEQPDSTVAYTPAGEYPVEEAPSITAEKIDEVLASYNSPAQGLGRVFVDTGARYGINPAYALAFYIHESHAGTRGVARFTKSIGNIRHTPGYKNYEGYRSYDSFEESIEDWYKLIRGLYIDEWGLRTVAQILPVYAPPEDNNDTGAYIASVQHLVDSWR